MSPQSALPDRADGVGVFHLAEVLRIFDRGFDPLLEFRRSFQMITRKLGIDFGTPGIDAAAQALHVGKAVTLKIGGRVHASAALVIINDEKIFA